MLRRTLLATIALLVGVTVAPLARADDGAETGPERALKTAPSLDVSLDAPRPIVPPQAPLLVHAQPEGRPRMQRRWYGYQIIAADVAALVTSAAADVGYGGFVYLTGGPLVHMMHGNYAEAAGSAGMRLGLPIAGVQLGLLIPSDSGWGQMENAIRGAMLGTLSAVVIDSVIAFKRVPVEADRLAVTPVVGGSTEGAVVGLGGAF